MPIIYTSYVPDMSQIFSRYVPYMSRDMFGGLFLRYAREIPEISRGNTLNIIKICLRYFLYMSHIYPIYFKDMPKICPRYVKDMRHATLAHPSYARSYSGSDAPCPSHNIQGAQRNHHSSKPSDPSQCCASVEKRLHHQLPSNTNVAKILRVTPDYENKR